MRRPGRAGNARGGEWIVLEWRARRGGRREGLDEEKVEGRRKEGGMRSRDVEGIRRRCCTSCIVFVLSIGNQVKKLVTYV